MSGLERVIDSMKRLTRYLARLFVTDALILFAVVCFLLWLVNCLRSFDVVSAKGQGFHTLAFQALLTMPQLAIAFFYVCVGIGMARALQALQANRELHIIHTSYGLKSLWAAAGLVMGGGVLCALLLSNFIEPMSNRRLNGLTASIAADLVSSTLKPQRFTQVTPQVVMLIGGRFGNGDIREFYADDRRDALTRRTYIAETARVTTDGETYVLELNNGTLQYMEADGRYSEITFGKYFLNVESLAQPTATVDPLLQIDSVTLYRDTAASGEWTSKIVMTLVNRMAEGLRVIGICIVVLAMTAFPSGKRAKLAIPMEATLLLLAFAERGISAYSPWGAATGGLAMIGIGGLALLLRARPRRVPQAVPA